MNVILEPGTHVVVRRTRSQGFSNLARLVPPTHTEPKLDELRLQAVDELNNFLYDRATAAPSVDDLAYVLDDLLDDPTYAKLRARLGSLLSSQAVDSGVDSLPPPLFLKAIVHPDDTELTALVDQGYRLMKSYMVAWLQFLALAIKRENKSDGSPSPATPMEFVRDARLPLEWRRVALAHEQSGVALDVLMALSAPSRSGRPVRTIDRWMVEYLLKTWVTGVRAYLIWLAGFPGIDPPDAELVAPGEIKNITLAVALHASEEAGYQERLKAARAAGGWYPTPDPDGED